MAKETEKAPPEQPPAQAAAPSPFKGLLPVLLMSVLIAAAAAGGGYVTGRMLTRTAQAKPVAPGEPQPRTTQASEEHFYYHRLEPIMANLSDARMARYIRTTPTLVIRPEDKDAAVALLENKKPEIKGWMVVYLSGCTIENVRGPDNLKRIQREIMDGLNDKLWPDQRPLIVDVILEDIAVQ